MRVSGATLCPLGQPNKAIGHEPLIGPWLATLRPPGLSVSGAESDRHDCRITPREEANLLASHREANRNCTSNQGGWMPAKTVSGSRLREECFFLDIPFNRTFREQDFTGRTWLRCSYRVWFPWQGPRTCSPITVALTNFPSKLTGANAFWTLLADISKSRDHVTPVA
jgi:hypothetical protein